MSISANALKIATDAHFGQERWDGSPYITHSIAVANIVLAKLESLDVGSYNEQCYAAIAYLHDVLEDTKITAQNLIEAQLPLHVVEAILILTRNKNESYLDYILRIKQNGYAKTIKLADLEHNMSDLKPSSRKDKYMMAQWILLNGD